MIPKTHVIAAVLMVVAALVITCVMYPSLPDPVPTHWNLSGEVNGYTAKPWGAFVGPMVLGGLLLVFVLLPAISPRGFRLSGFIRVYAILMNAVMGLVLGIMMVALLAAAGAEISVARTLSPLFGAFIMVLGNYLGKLRRNFFVGIRTPWTLSSDEVWSRTHRLAGWVFVAAGAAMLILGVVHPGLVLPLVLLGIAILIPVIYSYVLYRRLEGFTGRGR